MYSDWVKVFCKFCDKPLERNGYFPPGCDCEGYEKARKEYVDNLDRPPPLTPEEFDKKYPVVYTGSRVVQDKDGTHKLILTARNYDGDIGLTVEIPFGEDGKASLGWDFVQGDAEKLHELLSEYLEK